MKGSRHRPRFTQLPVIIALTYLRTPLSHPGGIVGPTNVNKRWFSSLNFRDDVKYRWRASALFRVDCTILQNYTATCTRKRLNCPAHACVCSRLIKESASPNPSFLRIVRGQSCFVGERHSRNRYLHDQRSARFFYGTDKKQKNFCKDLIQIDFYIRSLIRKKIYFLSN